MSFSESEQIVVEIEDLENPSYWRGIEAGQAIERIRILKIIHNYRNKPDFTIDNLVSLIESGKDD
jgi:hypothetical protein